jgi:hypothetical protein
VLDPIGQRLRTGNRNVLHDGTDLTTIVEIGDRQDATVEELQARCGYEIAPRNRMTLGSEHDGSNLRGSSRRIAKPGSLDAVRRTSHEGVENREIGTLVCAPFSVPVRRQDAVG